MKAADYATVRMGTTFVAALSQIALIASCGGSGTTSPLTATDMPARPPHRAASPVARITQGRYGNEARFVLCPVGGCPEPTPKTLAAASREPSSELTIEPLPLATQPAARQLSPPQAVERSPTFIPFASGSAALREEARKRLNALLPDARRASEIQIRGRTDELGSVAVNETLARDRAFAVRNYLRTRNLPESTLIRVSAQGACCYVAGNDTPEGRAANRRVEIELAPSSSTVAALPTDR
jgi:outer membrane protein OmpA-like peptidoglycan-associated protein